MTARRNADTVRTTRGGIEDGLARLEGRRRGNYQSHDRETMFRRRVAAPKRHKRARALRRGRDMATLRVAGLPPIEVAAQMADDRKEGPATGRGRAPATAATRAEIDSFLAKVKGLAPSTASGQRGRLIFALDATMSRQPTWDTACSLQADMFREAAAIGGLDVQLVYYRGLGECRASQWVSQAERLGALMERIDCRGGHTQIGKIIAHAKRETRTKPVQALVFVGDAMEEKLDDLCHSAGELGLLGVPAFMFQEGGDPITEQAFREIARLSRGAYCRFDPGAAHQLAELLRAAAAYAAGGMRALADLSSRHGEGALKLLAQMRP
jgi:hypothetical protein